jgi:hypothetical protein
MSDCRQIAEDGTLQRRNYDCSGLFIVGLLKLLRHENKNLIHRSRISWNRLSLFSSNQLDQHNRN